MSDSLHKFERFGWGLRVAGGSAPVAEDDDLGAEMLAAEVEAGENPGDGESAVYPADEGTAAAPGDGAADAATDAVDDASGDGGDLSAYPGIAILPDTLGARRNAVLAAITTEKLTRLAIAMDPSRADFLAGEATRYWNWPKDVPFPPELERNYADFCMHRDWREKIIAFALSLEASALTADMIQLENMARDLGSGWPT